MHFPCTIYVSNILIKFINKPIFLLNKQEFGCTKFGHIDLLFWGRT